jgi:hypothetical protein
MSDPQSRDTGPSTRINAGLGHPGFENRFFCQDPEFFEFVLLPNVGGLQQERC